MDYLNIRNKLNRYYQNIPKYEKGEVIRNLMQKGMNQTEAEIAYKDFGDNAINELMLDKSSSFKEHTISLTPDQMSDDGGYTQDLGTKLYNPLENRDYGQYATGRSQQLMDESEDAPVDLTFEQRQQQADNQALTETADLNRKLDRADKLSNIGNTIGKVALNTAPAAFQAADQLAMGDKNFGALSAVIDSAVHGVSGALMSSGNPYAMAAGAVLEGANFLTKAGGQTVQGFDVNINGSGYGNLGHMESSSSRDFGALIGLGGLNKGRMQLKLARRNEQARMALQAAEISQEQSFQQEARMNSIDNVLRNNQMALAGGIDTNLLGA